MTAQMELAGRSLKGQRKQADRVGARWLAVLGDDGDGAARHGDRGGGRRGAPDDGRSHHIAREDAG